LNPRLRILAATDRLLAVLVATLLLGTTLAFGGAVWWARPALAMLTLLVVVGVLVRVPLVGSLRVLKSPLSFLGLLALALAVVQLAPLPGPVATRVSPRSYEVYSRGAPFRQALALDPSLEVPPGADVRAPVTLDRSATLRWLAGAAACLALFWAVSQFADRLAHLYVVWGSIVAGFLVNSAIALVQLVSRSGGLYGWFEPGKGPSWAPSVNDLLTSPNAAVLRPLGDAEGALPEWAALVPDRPFLVGTLMGGPGAYLALGSIGLPLALGLLLQLLAPRGSREGFRARLGHSGQGGLVVLLALLVVISALLVGVMAGRWLWIPFALSLLLAGIPGAWASGLRWTAVAMTGAAVVALATGVALGAYLAGVPGAGPSDVGLETAARVWSDAGAIVRDFPVLGAGLGSFASVYPFYKSLDQTQTTALSSLVQWVVESGAAGAAVLAAAFGWCLFRLPGAVRKVGSADRSLAFGLIGAAAGFSLYSLVHWTVELAAVALAASALGGAGNRWLAGGTDLFVERT
jgi:hypothetical protein